MKFIRGLYNLPSKPLNCAVTIGNFDGVHLGHQALLKQLIKKASALNLPTAVIIFEPQPNEFFANNNAPPRLMRLHEKLMALAKFNVDYVICLRFNKNLADISAEQFIETILIKNLAVRYLIVGDDFRFGNKRTGDFSLLKKFGQQHNFYVEALPSHTLHKQRISSTSIRQALANDDLVTAEQLLGRPYGISGRVAHGEKRGRIIGLPTANVFLHRKAVPIQGVFIVKVYGLAATPIYGVANIGNRPTVDGTRSLLEVHLFNFNQNIYGRAIYTEFIHKLRDEKRFDSFELLKQQIWQDVDDAKKFLATANITNSSTHNELTREINSR